MTAFTISQHILIPLSTLACASYIHYKSLVREHIQYGKLTHSAYYLYNIIAPAQARHRFVCSLLEESRNHEAKPVCHHQQSDHDYSGKCFSGFWRSWSSLYGIYKAHTPFLIIISFPLPCLSVESDGHTSPLYSTRTPFLFTCPQSHPAFPPFFLTSAHSIETHTWCISWGSGCRIQCGVEVTELSTYKSDSHTSAHSTYALLPHAPSLISFFLLHVVHTFVPDTHTLAPPHTQSPPPAPPAPTTIPALTPALSPAPPTCPPGPHAPALALEPRINFRRVRNSEPLDAFFVKPNSVGVCAHICIHIHTY